MNHDPEVSKHGITLLAFLFLEVSPYGHLYVSTIVHCKTKCHCKAHTPYRDTHTDSQHRSNACFALQESQGPSTTEINPCPSVRPSLWLYSIPQHLRQHNYLCSCTYWGFQKDHIRIHIITIPLDNRSVSGRLAIHNKETITTRLMLTSAWRICRPYIALKVTFI